MISNAGVANPFGVSHCTAVASGPHRRSDTLGLLPQIDKPGHSRTRAVLFNPGLRQRAQHIDSICQDMALTTRIGAEEPKGFPCIDLKPLNETERKTDL